MKRKLLKGLALFAAAFPTLFVLRLLYGYTTGPTATFGLGDAQSLSSFDAMPKNYASARKDKGEWKGGAQAQSQGPVAVDQKYEKIATLRSESGDFERDERAVRDAIRTHNALIQFEQSSGLAGRRSLRMSIGVPPDRFDAMLVQVRRIGALTALQVNKTDKTNEYKDLNAKRVSLEKARDALVRLKVQGGRIEELTNLEDKILAIEENIQKLGVRLGEFDAENEFVTIQLELHEKNAAPRISFAHRVKVALEWTVAAYIGLVVLFFLAALSTLMAIKILEKLRWIPEAARRHLG